MKFPPKLIVIDSEARQQPLTEGWNENIEIAADLVEQDKVTARFHEAGPDSGKKFMEWYAACDRPLVTSFNVAWDKERLKAVGATDIRWALDILPVVYRQMLAAGALQDLDSGPAGRKKWPTVEEAAQFYGVPVLQAHDVRDDATMAAKIVIAINERK